MQLFRMQSKTQLKQTLERFKDPTIDAIQKAIKDTMMESRTQLGML